MTDVTTTNPSGAMTSDEERARDFALKAHGTQLYGSDPYIVHVDDVVRTLRSFGLTGPVLLAGYLHDTVEDTPTTLEEIEADFGLPVRILVWSVTGVGKNRKERRQCMYDRVRSLTDLRDDSTNLKLSDTLSNGRQSRANNPGLYEMYKKEFPHFAEMLGDHGDPRIWDEARRLFLPE